MYQPSSGRYDTMTYRRCGRSGIDLPIISLGLWHNWGDVDIFENARAMTRRAFDLGITHFDLANNYGPPYGSAEKNFGRILEKDFKPFRDELLISTKAGWDMWPGPYGNFGSRKYLVSSLDQSLKRMGLDYVDIFYHHRPDDRTPLEETMGALDHIVRSGRALYVGISQYSAEQTKKASKILKDLGTPCLIHQPKYNMFERWVEDELLATVQDEGIGCIPFSPLAQGLLTDKYFHGVPEHSRAGRKTGYLRREDLTTDKLQRTKALSKIAKSRNQSMAQLAIAWVLRQPSVTSALIGASTPQHIEEIVAVTAHLDLSPEETAQIEEILS